MPSLQFKLDGNVHQIELFADLAPQTIGRLVATLPATIDIHCAKIAGQHIFWHAPLVADIEKPADILTLPEGTFLYWPERQFLELIYGELQAEKAQVSVLGRLTGEIGWLKTFGKHVVKRHGHEILRAELLPGEGCAELVIAESPVTSAGLQRLRQARQAMWREPAKEMFELLRRQGMMMPYGPLAMAEGELRKLHELLWRLRTPAHSIAKKQRGQVAGFLIDAFNARIDGFCGLAECGKVLEDAKPLLHDAKTSQSALDELILFTGRAAAWLDCFIPWSSLNETTQAALRGQDIRVG